LLSSTSRVVGYIGGYGSGKTRGGGCKAVQLALINGAGEGMIVAPSYKMLIRVTLPAFLAAAGGLVVEHHKQEARVTLANGARIWLGTTDDPSSLEGSNLSWFWLDEGRLASWEAFRILLGRLRVDEAKLLQGVVTSTPAAGTWLEREFCVGKKDRQLIKVSSRDNPFLADGYVDNLLSSYSEREARAYIDGEWLHLDRNRLYPEYDPELHVVDWTIDNNLPIVVGVDFGYRWPAIIYGQITQTDKSVGGRHIPKNSLIVVDEEMRDGVPTEMLGQIIAQRFGQKISWIACDPAGSNFSSQAAQHRGLTDVQALRSSLSDNGCHAGIRYLHWKGAQHLRSVNGGIEKIRGMLKNGKGETRLFFSSSLIGKAGYRGVLKSMANMTWRKDTLKPLRGDPAENLDHANDALRYLVRHLDLAPANTINAC
jgi:hypothetical protein